MRANSSLRWVGGVGLLVLMMGLGPAPGWSATELKIGYMAHPIHEVSIKWMKQWAEKNNVTITPVPVSYEVYVEKMTANLTSGGDQYDVIWHNDDWGQLWGRYLEPIEDIPAAKKINKFLYEPYFVWDGHYTGLPFVETMGSFFYRSDLIKESEFPRTWDQLVKVSEALQKAGKAPPERPSTLVIFCSAIFLNRGSAAIFSAKTFKFTADYTCSWPDRCHY